MKIEDYGELNALHRLLGKIKFQEDLDFYEFREFVGSPFIAEIYKKVHKEFWEESINKGYIKAGQEPEFKFKSAAGLSLRKRIDDLSEKEIETLVKNQDVDQYLEILIAPLKSSEDEFKMLKDYFNEKVKKAST
ncbi:hypothetical protein [Pontibacter amylolyticus]|uniref:Uncharacterized protein n=1 Tax=Pontibacter amylolyticus TaxID=1424080 RepID=A0ABQ1VXB4_9BACT|nr:hypothetical protein [Pontibacter amylolyticus]GGG02170.1 hypothetical protein GCM10011323_03710 [Pontibacter amylolyticus]